ncbi:MAG TPA: glycosyltransferase family 87 protein [Acetobacteraceae bacterium]|nr:glycosyltransferase family 87 protein [Acetobacteraceae bacterium]
MTAGVQPAATRRLSIAHLLREAAFLTPERVTGWSGVLLAFEVLALGFLVLWTHGAFAPQPPTTTGFSSFYAAGRLALGPAPYLAYDAAAHYAAQQAATQPGVEHFVFYYPPVFLLLCAALARLPYMAAFLLFEAATLALCLPVGTRILARPGRARFLPVVAFPAVIWTVGLGQNALLTAAILGGGLMLLDRRPALAGVVLGLLCYKPHFGLLLPVALIAGRRWRAVAGAAAAVAALGALSLALFGWRCWHDYLLAFAASGSVYASGQVSFAAMVTPFGAALLWGASSSVATVVQGVALLLAAAVVAWVWRQPDAPLAARASVLLAATLIAVPLALFYDMMPLGLGVFWLSAQGRRDGFRPWERLMLGGVYLAPLVARYVALGLHVPLGLIASLVLLALGVTRARPAG